MQGLGKFAGSPAGTLGSQTQNAAIISNKVPAPLMPHSTKATDAEHKGGDPDRPQQPTRWGARRRLGGGAAHAGAAAIASRGTGRSRIRQWIAAAKRPSPIEIHHIRS